jgi:hypothetical protein
LRSPGARAEGRIRGLGLLRPREAQKMRTRGVSGSKPTGPRGPHDFLHTSEWQFLLCKMGVLWFSRSRAWQTCACVWRARGFGGGDRLARRHLLFNPRDRVTDARDQRGSEPGILSCGRVCRAAPRTPRPAAGVPQVWHRTGGSAGTLSPRHPMRLPLGRPSCPRSPPRGLRAPLSIDKQSLTFFFTTESMVFLESRRSIRLL